MRLTFHGAAAEVTGSCYLVDTGEVKFLIECGMFQGGRAGDAKNRRFAFDPREIAFVLLSHAHIDHSGLIPRLVARGFAGAVYATQATCDLLGVMLPDAGHLQEKEAQWSGDEPLYTEREARASLERRIPVEYGAEVRPHPAVRACYRDAGHILGSAIVELFIAGNRDHKNLQQTLDEFVYALDDTLKTRRGNVIIPAFAVGRTQDILHHIGELQMQRRLPSMDVYVDSPMALAALRVYRAAIDRGPLHARLSRG